MKEHVLDNLEAIGNVGISAIASMRSRLDSAYNTLLSPLAWKRKRDKLNNIRTDLQNRLDEFEREKARFKADYQKDCHFLPGAQRIENFDLLRSRITFLLQEEARLTKR